MAIKTASKSFPVEKLCADNFLSLHNFEYEVNSFNIITGDIASGKSLIIKTLEFFENIFSELLMQPYEKFLEYLDMKCLSEKLIKDFDERFDIERDVLFDISYSYTYKKEIFEIKLYRERENREIYVESKFLERELNSWKGYIKEQKLDAPHKFFAARNELITRFSNKFNNLYLPVTTFIPATRAALATGKGNFSDPYLMEYQDIIGFLKMRKTRSKYIDEIYRILKAKIEINRDFRLVSEDKRNVRLAFASSGQQEVFYILLLLDKLTNININMVDTYTHHYIFIEEPEAHLFPREQKQVLELIVRIFNDINSNPKCTSVKFFITTHSPYVLNTINNMLIKGNIIKNNEEFLEQIEKDEKTKLIPCLNHENVSAVFINKKGNADPILKKYGGDYLINPDEINNISECIDDNFSDLDELKTKLKNKNA